MREGTRDVEPARAHCVVVARGAEIRRALTDQPAQVGVLEVGVGRQQQRHRAADMGRRHRGARRAHIVRAYREGRRTLVGRRSEGKDIAPGHVDPDRSARAASGRRHVHPPAEIRESLGGPIVLARGGHGDDLPHILRAIGHHVGIAIARRGDDHCPHGMNPAHDLLGQGIARACGAARPTRVDHPRPVVGGVEDRAPEVRIESLALGGKALEGHDARLGGDAGDSDAVIRHRGDGARDMRAVATVIEGVRVSHVQRSIVKAVQISVDGVCEIESPEIVDEAVAVVIDAVPIGRVHPAVGVEVFAGIDPDVCRDVRVEIVESGIHHGHHHTFALGEGPSLGGAHAFQSPEIVEVLVPTARRVKEGVVGREGCLVQLVGVVTLDPGDVGVFAIERQCGLGGHALTDLHAVDVGEVRRRRSALAAGAAPSASSSLLLHLLLQALSQSPPLLAQGTSVRTTEEGANLAHSHPGLQGVKGVRAVPGFRGEGPPLAKECFGAPVQGVPPLALEFDDDALPAGLGECGLAADEHPYERQCDGRDSPEDVAPQRGPVKRSYAGHRTIMPRKGQSLNEGISRLSQGPETGFGHLPTIGARRFRRLLLLLRMGWRWPFVVAEDRAAFCFA